jgi:hypothetical protein
MNLLAPALLIFVLAVAAGCAVATYYILRAVRRGATQERESWE